MMIHELYRALVAQGASAQHHQGEVKLQLPKTLNAALKQQLIERKDELKQYLLGLYASAAQASAITPIPRTQEHYPLSSAQQRLWFIDQLQSNTVEYNMSAAFSVCGQFDPALLEQTMQSIVARHEILRTRYIEVAGEGRQIVQTAPSRLVCFHDLSHLDASAQQAQLERLQTEEAAYNFDLATDSLIRVHYTKLSPEQGMLMFNLHHIVSDGYSVALLVEEFSQTYAALAAGQQPELTPLPLHYIDYAQWQQNETRTQYQTQLDYWQKQLENAPEVHTLPLSGLRDAQQHPAQKYTQQLPQTMAEAVANSADTFKLSPFAFLHALLSLVLARHSHSQDIVIGTPVENRLHNELQSLMGFFVNTVPLRVSTEFDTLAAYFEHVKGINQQALANQALPLEQLIEGLQISRTLVHAPLFQILLTVEGTPAQPVSTHFSVADVQLTQQALPVSNSKFDLDINLVFNEQGLALNWVYDSQLFNADYIAMLSAHLTELIRAFVSHDPAALAQQSPQQVDMLSEQERQQLLYDVQSDTLVYDPQLSLHQQISHQAQLTPDAIAIEMPGGRTLSYAQLDAGANRIAAYLQHHYTLGADTMVGVSTLRHAEMVMVILAILKTGAAYLPLDPSYPSARLAQIIDDARPLVTITDTPAALDGLAIETLSLATLCQGEPALSYQPVAHQVDNLAYAIYTSGSTGKPKGVAIRHRNVNALLSWADTVYSREDYARVLCSTSINFDLSAFELFFTLTRGGTCVLVDNALSLLDHPLPVTLINTVPSAIKALLEQGGIPAGVRVVNLAGEPLGRDVVNQLLAGQHCERVYNLYGPSEDTTYSTYACFTQEIDHVPSIGRAISNTQALILNDQLALLPYGATGELYLGGDGLAQGYLNQPALTAERFIDNPFYDAKVAGSSKRLYRTGDLVRYQADGNLAFVGRADDQIKIRGFRVELGEISEQLSRQAAIDSAVVVAKNGANGVYLVAYVQPAEMLGEESHAGFISQALNTLASRLPDYMVPKLGRVMSQWPLTASGKIDKKALPEVEAGTQQGVYVAPQNDTERAVCAIWAELLNIDAAKISATDSFFELGGHSLLSVKLAAALRTQLGAQLPLSILFNAATVAEQAKEVIACQGQALPEGITAQPRVLQEDPQLGAHSTAPLSFAQQRLWFIEQLEQGSAQYNMPSAFHVQGALDLNVVESVLQTIIARHEVLRTVYRDELQVIRQHADFTLGYEDLRMLSETARQQAIATVMSQQLNQPFDLTREVMVRASYIQTADSSGVLLFNMHHIASDGWSMQVLVKEFAALYQAYSRGQSNPLTPLAIQYADYAQWQRDNLTDTVLAAQLGYWQQQLADIPAVHSLPLDKPRPDVKQHQGGQVKSTLNGEVAKGLTALANVQGLTPFMLLHGALSLLLSRHSNARDIAIGTPVANRLQAELAPLIGFFVNTLVLNVSTAHATLADYLAHVKAVHLGAQSNQDVPFEQLVEQLNVPRSSAYSPLFQVMLTIRGDYEAAEQVENTGWSLGEAKLSPLAEDAVIAKFDLDVDIALSDGGVEICWTYDKALFNAKRIETLAHHLEVLLTTLAQQQPQALLAQPPGTVTMLSAEEQQELLVTFNQQVEHYDPALCIHTVFEQQVQATPHATALVCNAQRLSYATLNQRANQLAHYLLSEHRVTPETLIGVCTSRSVEMVVSILAILKAGGAYVPLDPDYPISRLSYMASDAGLKHLLGFGNGLTVAETLMAEQGGTAIDITALQLDAYPHSNPVLSGVCGTNLAYVIYTSGSTGKPKGVAVEHGSLVNYQCHCRTQYGLSAEDVMLQFSTMSFDIFVEELFGALCQGASLVLRSEECLGSAQAFNAFCSAHQITVMSLPTAFWKQMSDMDNAFAIETLRAVIIGGEAMSKAHMTRFFAAAPGVTLFNSYGPTEATITATTSRLHKASDAEQITIGKANVNNTLLILNEDGGLVPKGSEGELYIGGPGVARGYLNQPTLSAERFIRNPYADQCVAIAAPRLYRTGDLVRYTEQGELIFIGRNDDQIKLRGFRVELGELNGILAQLPQVQDAAVTVFKVDTEQHLAAYLKLHPRYAEADPQSTLQAISQQLAEQLPHYMQPGSVNLVDELPLTVNGKLDVAALPQPRLNVQQREYCAPSSELEHQLVAIWAQLLSRDAQDIGVTTSFFNLGGHSLLILKAVSQIQSQLEVTLTVQTIFENDTVATLAAEIERQRNQHALKQQINDASADQIERVEF